MVIVAVTHIGEFAEPTEWRVKRNVMCLGFFDEGPNPVTCIDLGGSYLEDRFLVFDLASSYIYGP